MKIKNIYSTTLSMFVLLALLASCGLDNYDEPQSYLKGKIVYNGEAVNVRGTDERVRLQLYQDGYAYKNPIEIFVGQDGSFSAALFNGDYKLVTRDGNGPWVNSRDTTYIKVSGNTEMNFEVTPFFTISNASITLSGNTVNANFNINQIVNTAEIDRVIILLNKTAFVDDDMRVQRVDFTDNLSTGAVSYSIELNDDAKKANVLNARVCVWTKGADQGIYSPVINLK